MKNLNKIFLLLSLLLSSVFLYAQKTISEGTLVYDIVIQTANKEPQLADAIDGGTITIKIKGTQSRSDMVSALGKETTLCDTKTGNATILKEYSGQKLMITFSKENWDTKNKVYSNIQFKLDTGAITILGYNCKKAIAKIPNGKSLIVYYSPDLVIANKDYNTTLKNLPGLAMQYEYQSNTMKYKYTLSQINLDAVLASTFEVPKNGYRVLTYEENLQMNKDNP